MSQNDTDVVFAVDPEQPTEQSSQSPQENIVAVNDENNSEVKASEGGEAE